MDQHIQSLLDFLASKTSHVFLNEANKTLVLNFLLGKYWDQKKYLIFRIEAHEPYPELNGGQLIRRARGLVQDQLLHLYI